MQKPKYRSSKEIADDYSERMKEWLKYAYDEGYKAGSAEMHEQFENLREKHKRAAGKYDDVYAKNWRDNTTFYGWCDGCGRPHSGRWAHVWKYCPWCGGEIDRTDEPYPMGRKEESADE